MKHITVFQTGVVNCLCCKKEIFQNVQQSGITYHDIVDVIQAPFENTPPLLMLVKHNCHPEVVNVNN